MDDNETAQEIDLLREVVDELEQENARLRLRLASRSVCVDCSSPGAKRWVDRDGVTWDWRCATCMAELVMDIHARRRAT